MLYHYGISAKDNPPGRGSGRYPLGSGDRPYQSQEGNTQKKVSKEQVIKSGSIKDILAIQDQLTTKELQEAYNRINLQVNLTRILNSPTERKQYLNNSVMNSTVNELRTLTGWVGSGIAAYNIAARIYNKTPQGRTRPLPAV